MLANLVDIPERTMASRTCVLVALLQGLKPPSSRVMETVGTKAAMHPSGILKRRMFKLTVIKLTLSLAKICSVQTSPRDS